MQGRERERESDRQTGRQAGRQAGRQTDRETERETRKKSESGREKDEEGAFSTETEVWRCDLERELPGPTSAPVVTVAMAWTNGTVLLMRGRRSTSTWTNSACGFRLRLV